MAAVTTICLGFLLVCAVHLSLTGGLTAATSQWANDRVQDHPAYREAGDFLTVLQNIMNRHKRTRPDAGFVSRHDAMRDYINAVYAKELASDPFGPGKRK